MLKIVRHSLFQKESKPRSQIFLIRLFIKITQNFFFFQPFESLFDSKTCLVNILDKYFSPFIKRSYELINSPSCLDLVMRFTFKSLIKMLENIILDGGDDRVFAISDKEAILEDLNAAEKFFWKDGKLVANFDFLRACTKKLRLILNEIWEKPTKALLEGSESEGILAFEKLPWDNKNNLNLDGEGEMSNYNEKKIWTQKIVLKILYHRSLFKADMDGRKYLKHLKFDPFLKEI